MIDQDASYDRKGDPAVPQEILEQVRKKLTELFGHLEHEVPLILFTDPLVNSQYSEAARAVIRAVRELTDKVSLREFGLNHELAQKYNVSHSPTLLFDPENIAIRWLGAPVGEEGRTFMEAITMLGHRKTEISGPSQNILDKIDSPRAIKLFITPTCPYCPQQAVNALKAAIAKPQSISLLR
jgi:thioredoxin reductase (NADPH)